MCAKLFRDEDTKRTKGWDSCHNYIMENAYLTKKSCYICAIKARVRHLKWNRNGYFLLCLGESGMKTNTPGVTKGSSTWKQVTDVSIKKCCLSRRPCHRDEIFVCLCSFWLYSQGGDSLKKKKKIVSLCHKICFSIGIWLMWCWSLWPETSTQDLTFRGITTFTLMHTKAIAWHA